MKARYVYENLEFERGRSTKEVIGVGTESLLIADLDQSSKMTSFGIPSAWKRVPAENWEVAAWKKDYPSPKYVSLITAKEARKQFSSLERGRDKAETKYPDYAIYYDLGPTAGICNVEFFSTGPWSY